MEDDNMVTGVSPVADEWDMLSLTSSVYASPLFRRGFDPINLPGYGDVNDSQEGTQTGLVMSNGFVFPPSEHENLPIEPDHEDLPIESGHNVSKTNSNGKESCAGNNDDDWCHVSPEEVDGISNENLSDNSDLPLPSANATPLPDSSPVEINAKQEKDHMICKADISCEGWWKRKSTYLFHHIKGVTTVCSIVAAGTVVGFVVMGQRWQQDHLHLHQFKFSVSSETAYQPSGGALRHPTPAPAPAAGVGVSQARACHPPVESSRITASSKMFCSQSRRTTAPAAIIHHRHTAMATDACKGAAASASGRTWEGC